MIFNKQVSKEEYDKIRDKIQNTLHYWVLPVNLSENDICWLKKNVKQFDQKVLADIINNSVLPYKPKEYGNL